MTPVTKEQVGKGFAIAKTVIAVAVAVVQGIELVTAAATASHRMRNRSNAPDQPRPTGRGWRVDHHNWDYEEMEDLYG